LQIKGSDSKLVFHGGKLHIPDNQTFTFTYPNAESGFIEVLAGTENMLHTETNSIFLLEGEGSEDLILRIAPGAHIQNPNFAAGSMILRDGLIEMEGLTKSYFFFCFFIFLKISHPFLKNQIFSENKVLTYL
jgi:hypothetical protein